MQRRPVRDDLSDVGAAISWADDIAARAGVSERVRNDLQVCLEEALANLIMHGKAEGDKDIAVEIGADAQSVEVRIWDRSAPFDATTAPLGELQADRSGGAGLRLLRAFASELQYESRYGLNRLTMKLRDG